ncbi:aldehyde-activating protein [Rhizobium sullae]|uniref:Aldehyde-activating protein n=1 Tax=Rhizobium sullae TaxID=50338 RepID=A0A2N0DCK0_RHISU|nr:GFA family protein [Rhizobium sullae]PKA43812.1 aldehyde-activating protein [Rhizobium sullae]
MTSKPITGRCFCGAAQFEVSSAPILKRACWCRDCQYLSCGNASINVVFASGDIVIKGELAEYASVADSGQIIRRRFCPTCGTQMFSEAMSQPGYIVVRVGTLDQPNIAEPTSVIWTASAPDWAWINPHIPRFEKHVEAVQE